VADNYYADKEAVLKLYEGFIEKYENEEHANYDPVLELAKHRSGMLKKELFMDSEEK
jgi:hypothetical protein